MEEEKLPKGWIITHVEDIALKLFAGGDVPKQNLSKEKTEQYDIPIYGNGIKDNGLYGYTDIIKVKEPCITISARGTIGYPILRNESFYPIVRLIVLKPYDNINLRFLKYALQKTDFNNSGTSIPQLTVPMVKKLFVNIPPLPEQERIVAKLDQLFGHLEALKARLDKIPQLLKDFRQAVLTQAVTGKLTEEWREGKGLTNDFLHISSSTHREFSVTIPDSWQIRAFQDIAEIKSNLVNPNDFHNYPLIAPDNIEKEIGRLIDKPLVSEIKPKSSKHYFKSNSIIYSKIRPYLSKLIIADFDGLCSADMYPITSHIKLEYLFYYMLSSEFISYASTAGERSVLPKINQKGLNIIPITIPSTLEQKEIVRQVDAFFSKADIIEAKYQTLKEKIEQLPQAILAKAFRGELVEQLPTDGDARELLEEIKKLKEEVEAQKKANKKAQKKTPKKTTPKKKDARK